MHRLLACSTAARPSGSPPQRKLLRVPSGVFQGRLAALYADSADTIMLKYADYPCQSWSSAQSIVTDSHDSPFSACMDASGNIYLVYVDSAKDIKALKLTFAAGQWNVGSAATVINADDNYSPFILKDSDGKLWCLFANHRTSSDLKYLVRVKSSADDGQTWGTGPTDLGTQLSAASDDMPYAGALQVYSNLYCVYCVDRSDLKFRACNLAGPTWGLEIPLQSLDYIDDDFDIATTSNGKLGIVLAPASNGKVYLKEYDGQSWNGLCEVELVEARAPQLAYFAGTPHIFYARHLGSGYYSPRHAVRRGDSFVLSDYSAAFGIFERVFVYCDSAASRFQDKTSAAASVSAGDVLHSESQALLDSVNDCLYVGKQSKFCSVAVILSAVGVGGVVAWEYFDGSGWITFIPDSGAFNFDVADKLIYLWQDADSAPPDWQMGLVNGVNAFWVRARVTSGFSANPVGTQVLAAAKCDDLALVR